MKRRDVTDEERAAWLEENHGRPQKAEKKKPTPTKEPPMKKTTPQAPLEVGTFAHIDKKRAASRPDAQLDLHGLTQDKAHQSIMNFIKIAAARGDKTLLIITGKSGVLHEVVPRWLDTAPLRSFILAISYATPKEGGTGALRVLLKRRKP